MNDNLTGAGVEPLHDTELSHENHLTAVKIKTGAAIPSVIALLERYLNAARTQRWGAVAIVMTGHPNFGAAAFAGDITLERGTLEAAQQVCKLLTESIANWERPKTDPALDASHVCYNVANGPMGFDFLVWLIDAEMRRVREKAPGPLKVAFYCGRDAAARMKLANRQAWLDNVFRPLLPMLGAIETPDALHGHNCEVFVPRNIVLASLAGEAVPLLKYTRAVVPHNAVTITLREAAHNSNRNSNTAEWMTFAHYLQTTCNERVIFVRDTCRAWEPLPTFETCPPASLDLQFRFALYEGAKINYFVSNGPAGLATFGSRPYVTFIQPGDGSTAENCNLEEFWESFNGIPWGTQWPWARPAQRLIFAHDTFPLMRQSWEDFQCQPQSTPKFSPKSKKTSKRNSTSAS